MLPVRSDCRKKYAVQGQRLRRMEFALNFNAQKVYDGVSTRKSTAAQRACTPRNSPDSIQTSDRPSSALKMESRWKLQLVLGMNWNQAPAIHANAGGCLP